MKNEVNEWVALDNEGTIWAYCGPGTNNVLGLVHKDYGILNCFYQWNYETKDGMFRMLTVRSAAIMVQDFHDLTVIK